MLISKQNQSMIMSADYKIAVVCFVFVAHPDQIVCIIVCFTQRNRWNSWKTITTTSYIMNEAKIGNKSEFDYTTVCKGE